MKTKEVQVVPPEGAIILFGDSLVSGVGASPRQDLASILSTRLGEEVIAKGRAGDTSFTAIARLEGDVLFHKPRLVVVILGGNDVLKRLPKAETLKNMEYIVSTIQENGAAVLLVGISDFAYNKDYKRIAQEYGVAFVPNILDLTLGNNDLMSDPVHPNDKGYALFADALTPVLQKLLH